MNAILAATRLLDGRDSLILSIPAQVKSSDLDRQVQSLAKQANASIEVKSIGLELIFPKGKSKEFCNALEVLTLHKGIRLLRTH